MVRAKFKVKEIKRSQFGSEELQSIVLEPVYKTNNPDDENSKFFASSPSGRIELGCVNPAAAKQFELGEEYYIDFVPAN